MGVVLVTCIYTVHDATHKSLSTLLQKSATICRRKVRQSPNSATVAVVSPFSATIALFCDSVDRALNVEWTRCTVLNGNRSKGNLTQKQRWGHFKTLGKISL